MNAIIGSARSSETGSITGKAGDQTGKELSTQNWYAHAKGWTILRPKDAKAAEAIARCMEAACANRHIGYDQYQRNTLYAEAQKYGFDVSRVEKDVECDCSSLVRVCCAFAGINVPDFNTATEAAVLMKSGAFTRLPCTSESQLKRGDILVTNTKGHTAVVLSEAFRNLYRGLSGEDVKEMQRRLNRLGFSCGTADGIFGSNTEKGVRAFQTAAKIEVDGIFGRNSRNALQRMEAAI